MRRTCFSLLGITLLVGFIIGSVPAPVSAQVKSKSMVKAIEVYKDKGGKYRFRIRNEKGKSLAIANTGYKTNAEATKVISAIQKLAKNAKVSEESIKTKSALFAIYKDKGGKYRFRFTGEKGEKLARSSIGYKTKTELMAIIDVLQQTVATAKIESKIK